MKKFRKVLAGITAAALTLSAVSLMPQGRSESSKKTVNAEKADYNYAEVLQKSLFFYECQQAGPLPEWNRVSWRADSTMSDDVKGGWYDAGDHVKFNLPMAYSAAVLAWGLYQYGDGIEKIGEYQNYQNNLEFVLDYLVECDRGDKVVYQIGEGIPDHKWWGAAELVELEMGKRPSAVGDGSCVVGEMSAALAAGAAALRGKSDKTDGYLECAEHYFDLAWSVQSDKGYSAASTFYDSWSGFWDELFFAANWLYIATGEKKYLDKAEECIPNLGRENQSEELKYTWGFCWDDVTQGGFLLYAQNTGNEEYIKQVQKHLDYWSLPEGYGGKSVYHLPDGLAWLDSWGCLRYACNAGFLAAVASDTIFKDDAAKVKQYKDFYETQINYCLGGNADGRSYVIGYGKDSPEHPHHRTSHGAWDDMKDEALKHHRHVLYGALVGGPGKSGDYEDAVDNYVNNEVADDYNAGFTALLCKMVSEYGGETLADFPPVEEPDGPEFWIQANVNQESDTFTELKINSVNHSAWPARYITDLSYNYYFDISELLDAGLTADDITAKIGYDEWAQATVEGPVQYDGNIYYIKIKYSDGSVLAPIGKEQEKAEIQVRISIPDANKVWDASNDYSREGLSNDSLEQTIAERITMYDGDTLVWGTEPDGTKPSAGTPAAKPSASAKPSEKPSAPASDKPSAVPSDKPSAPASAVPGEPSGRVIYGDIDFNGTVDITDLSLLSLYKIGDRKLNDAQLEAADTEYDGVVDLSDLAKLKQFLSKIIDKIGK
ncbi:MAG: glycoside hydrolase family 9 protein [Oscillospiraceae bacterium]|nr:glycoside hydrolase family 9 protein [Oscillospiraceae bacterium]